MLLVTLLLRKRHSRSMRLGEWDGWQKAKLNVGARNVFSHDLSVIVTGIIQNENDAPGFTMCRPDLVNDLPQCLRVYIVGATHIDVLLIYGVWGSKHR